MLRLIQLLEQCTQCIKAYLGGGGPSRPLPLPLRKLIFFTSGGEVSVKSINLSIKNVTLNKSQRESRHDRSVGNLGVMQSPPPPLYKI